MPKRVGAGRPKGALNKATADVKALAQEYGPAAVRKLAEMGGLVKDDDGRPVGMAESEQAVVAAAREILDRAYGKAKQDMTIDAKVATKQRIEHVIVDPPKPDR